jgi:hypothetical protein
MKKLHDYACCRYGCGKTVMRTHDYMISKGGILFCSRRCAGVGNLELMRIYRQTLLCLMAL